ncbi:DUF3238 domain-containing protein [Brevibacillus reuszeri]|uniref:DUF3238 domain-containing protein n=1 Tax=Brevibacillus reuszeri TaxID=54915 RepID=UPI0036725F59
MAQLVKVRVATFIPFDKVFAYAMGSGDNTCSVFYGGDNRESYGSPAGTFRTAQEIWVDFNARKITPYKNTGTSHKLVECSDGQNQQLTDKVSDSCLEIKWISWGASNVTFRLICACGNPFEPLAPVIDYILDVTVWSNGAVKIVGDHDGFPAYEMFKKVDNYAWERLYLHDPRETGETIASLAPPMEHHVYVDK